MGYVHLQVHSSYTLLESTIDIDSYVEKAAEEGLNEIALTDHENLHGAYQFYKKCIAKHIKPIIGMTIDFFVEDEKRPCRMTLLAKNWIGYQGLVQLSNSVQVNNKQLRLEDFKAFRHDVLPILNIYDTFLEEMLFLQQEEVPYSVFEQMDSVFEQWYINVEPLRINSTQTNEWLNGLTQNRRDQLVVTCDVRYLKEDHKSAYEAMLAMKKTSTVEAVATETNSATHLLSVDELNNRIDGDWFNECERSAMLANQCQIEFPRQWFSLPTFEQQKYDSSDEQLEALCNKQIDHKYKNNHAEAKQRLEYELSVIQNMKFSDYFLIVWDIIRYAKQQKIMVGPGRGSAAGSIVAYLLDIIEVDPLKHELLFERFLNPERTSMPDIDIDFADYRRDEIIRYVNEKYDAGRAAQIITFGTFQARSTIRELSKVFQIDSDTVNQLLKFLPQQVTSLKKVVKESEELKTYVKKSNQLIKLFQAAFVIEGLPRHHSTHAAGVVIGDKPMTDRVPMIQGQDGVLLTQFPMKDLESIGLLKMDFLGLRNLTLLERMMKQIGEREGIYINLKDIDQNDEKSFQLLRNSLTTGVFQLESNGMQRVLRLVQPNQFEDIVAVNALFRPGPMQFIETYAKRKNGREKVKYIHQSLEPILKDTYGVLVYQEQVMQVVSKMAGFSYGEADLLRRAISKKDLPAIQQMKRKFIDGAIQNDYQQETAQEIFDWIERFADYGFNKSHAVAYSMISYQLAYFKANFPAYFYAELMSSVMHDHEKLYRYIQEAKRQGIKILPPSVNESFGKFTVSNNQHIRFGLLAIKGFGRQSLDEIIKARKPKPFESIFDFCQRVSLSAVNQSTIETLVIAGAFDETNRNRAQVLASIMQAIEQGELFSDMDQQISWDRELFNIEVEYTDVEPFPILKELQMEQQVLGFTLSDHPLSHVRRALTRKGMQTIAQAFTVQIKKTIQMVSSIDSIKSIRTKRGEQMAFVTLQDETGDIDGVIFPDVHREIGRWIEEGLIVQVKGTIEERNDKRQLILKEVSNFSIEDLPKTNDQQIFIKLTEGNEKDGVAQLRDLSSQYPGGTKVVVYSPTQKKSYQLSESYDLELTSENLESLRDIFQDDHVVVKSIQK
ncbi:DNA polymerase III subunit alpha [Halalkalibacillus sediminis]|uniref:DNA polymerase III subunit alpha n=1 Tax=Halalkalibacillus sediminis TaxID=2018042 RepID=UPI0013905145|nr:DNA polymerase III subunit alpha [Halalkalibacillus sediminis]